jgi:type IV pilus assembly protein PilW
MHVRTVCHRRHPTQAGFSLIEIMIALVIGMAAVIIMMQMVLNSDTSKRITVGGNDAQVTGTLALYNLERDIRASGYGLNSPGLLGCELTYKVGGKDVKVPLAPASINRTDIVPAGDLSTDTLLVVYGTASESGDGDPLNATSAADSYSVTRYQTFKKDDLVILQNASRPFPCKGLQFAKVKASSATGLTMENGTAGIPTGGTAFNVGQLVVRAYAVREGNLTMCDYRINDCGNVGKISDPDIWVPIAHNIVGMRAQYGQDTTDAAKVRTGIVAQYDQVTPPDSARSHCAWARVVALRIGLVARGTAYDKTLTDGKTYSAPPPKPTWSGASSPAGGPKNAALVDFDLSKADDTGLKDGWRNYRYKTFETLIPLRNTIWQGDTEC